MERSFEDAIDHLSESTLIAIANRMSYFGRGCLTETVSIRPSYTPLDLRERLGRFYILPLNRFGVSRMRKIIRELPSTIPVCEVEMLSTALDIFEEEDSLQLEIFTRLQECLRYTPR
jgi:hypothetical protein